jgi:hypothetical protein
MVRIKPLLAVVLLIASLTGATAQTRDPTKTQVANSG